MSAPAHPPPPPPEAPEVPTRAALRRDTDAGVIGGVVAGIADRLGTDAVGLRIVFIALTVVTGGALLVAYALAWALIPTPDGSTGISLPRLARGGGGKRWQLGAGVALLVLAALLVFRELGIWWSDGLIWPLVLLAGGIALLWGPTRGAQAEDEPPLAALRSSAPSEEALSTGAGRSSSLASLYRGGFGIALVLGAALLVLSANDALGAARDVTYTAVVSILALALILAPFIWRLGRNLAAERAARIRSQERAEVAAHLHDSVLQTLALVQSRAEHPREVVALARRQERELRSWLAGEDEGAEGRSFAAAIRAAAEGVEDDRRVRIDVVAVGDCELDASAEAAVGAAREALTNAAKFAPDGPISLYAEVTEDRVEVFVRDRGPGFDPDDVPADRRGVSESIIGRMRRHGGDATISSVPGSGTEVALRLERSGGGQVS